MPNRVHLFAAGSAPHARGTRDAFDHVTASYRFSPACAGNTKRQARQWHKRPVQPRMRGEHVSSAAGIVTSYGSAPHARGTLCTQHIFQKIVRFSPACAGNTASGSSQSRWWTVQPRMRGEHRSARQCRTVDYGSAPHARGTRCKAFARLQPSRFSPACAGNTLLAARIVIEYAVQPRMRGEHYGWH